MSKIPYFFRAIPDEFLTDEFIEDVAMMKFIRYIFKRIRYHPHEEIIQVNRQHKKILLQPYEFIFGRERAALECNVSERKIRTSSSALQKLGFLKKASSGSTSSYTVYKLVTTAFSKNSDQQFGPQSDQQSDQRFDHKVDREDLKDVKDQPSPKPPKKGGRKAKACGLAKACQEKNLPFSEHVIFKLYEKYPEATLYVLEKFNKRPPHQKKLDLPDRWLKLEVEARNEYEQQKKDYE